MLSGDTNAGIVNGDPQFWGVFLCGHCHRSSCGCVLQGIADEVDQNLIDTVFINLNPRQVRRKVYIEVNSLFFKLWAQAARSMP